jgi:hypothetical protein
MKREHAKEFLRELNNLTSTFGVRIDSVVGALVIIEEFKGGQCLLDIMGDKDKQDQQKWILSAPWPG